jgi:integrase
MTDTTNAYYAHLISTGRATAAESYRYALNGFEKWLKSQEKPDFDSYTYKDAELYMRTGFTAPRTANNFKIALVGLMKFKLTSIDSDAPEYEGLSRKLDQLRHLKNEKIIRKYEKSSLEIDEVKRFLKDLKSCKSPPVLYSLGLMLAFFGTRPIELERNIKDAKIDWEGRAMVHGMIIRGAKTNQPRYLCWPESLDAHVKLIYESAPLPYSGEYFTKNCKYYMKDHPGDVTAKTFRRTFETQERLLGVPDILIDAILGHENSGSRMGNVYTDYSSEGFLEKIREVMTTGKHYMIKNGII